MWSATIKGVFVTSAGFSVTLSGPIIGESRTEGKPGYVEVNRIIDLIDLVFFILLLMDEIRLISILVGPGRISLTVSGPIFGVPFSEPSLPVVRENLRFYRQMLTMYFGFDPKLFRNLERNDKYDNK